MCSEKIINLFNIALEENFGSISLILMLQCGFGGIMLLSAYRSALSSFIEEFGPVRITTFVILNKQLDD